MLNINTGHYVGKLWQDWTAPLVPQARMNPEMTSQLPTPSHAVISRKIFNRSWQAFPRCTLPNSSLLEFHQYQQNYPKDDKAHSIEVLRVKMSA